MIEKEIPLENADQRQFFSLLAKKSLPAWFSVLFSNISRALDFLQAFALFRLKYPQDSWSGTKLVGEIREQYLRLTTEQLREFYLLTVDRSAKQEIGFGLAMCTTCSSRTGDKLHAAKVIQHFANCFLQEDLMTGRDENKRMAFMLIPMLISSAQITRTWHLLAEGVRDRLQESEDAFRDLLLVFSVVQIMPHFVSTESDMYEVFTSPDGFGKILEELSQNFNPWDKLRHRIPVQADCAYACNVFQRKFAKQHCSPAEIIKMTAWFGAYEEQFQEQAATFWAEIRADTKYGLNPNGRDLVSVDIQEARQQGWHQIQLIPGEDTLHLTARYWVYLPGNRLRIAVDQHLEPGRLYKIADHLEEQDYSALTDKLMQFIALHSYWKIATGKIFKLRVKTSPKGETRRESLERNFLVRPHFRWLVPGQNASSDAINRSMETFQVEPPQGKTFVKSHVVSTSRIVTRPEPDAKPLIHYTNADLGYEA